ncbi:MAG: corrinoid-binding protein [Chloroflexia bacterium]|nr:corrinoid-binding protein [Chloroflexia bacterium]
MESIEELKQKLITAIIDARREEAVKLVTDWAVENSYKKAFRLVFEPVLETIGQMWYEDKISLAQGYVTGLIAEDVFMKAAASHEFGDYQKETKKRAVIGNIEDDFHSLGRKLIKIFLEIDGWEVIDLGNNVLAKDFVDTAVKNDIHVIGVSAMMFTTAKNIKKVRDELEQRGLTGKIKLAVGGAIFKLRKSLCSELGGDGTADNAIEAQKLFNKLL